jgi:hypothetical protein
MKHRTMPTRAKRTAALAVVITVLAALAIVLFRPRHHPAPAAQPTPVRTQPSPSPSPSQSAVALVKPAPPKIPHDAVAPAVPTAFEMKGAAFDIKANVCQMPNVRPLDPPGDQLHTVCWVESDFGVAPGSNARGTSYVLGHAWAEAQLVLNPLSEYAMKHVDEQHPVVEAGVPTYQVKALNGYTITLKTAGGTLTYKVQRAFSVSKLQAGDVPSLMANTPKRVVLITCGVRDGRDVEVNVVAYAYLVSSRSAHRPAAAPPTVQPTVQPVSGAAPLASE